MAVNLRPIYRPYDMSPRPQQVGGISYWWRDHMNRWRECFAALTWGDGLYSGVRDAFFPRWERFLRAAGIYDEIVKIIATAKAERRAEQEHARPSQEPRKSAGRRRRRKSGSRRTRGAGSNGLGMRREACSSHREEQESAAVLADHYQPHGRAICSVSL